MSKRRKWYELVSEYGTFSYVGRHALKRARVQKFIVGGTLYECWTKEDGS